MNKVAEKNKKKFSITIRINQEQHEFIKVIENASGVKMSEILRQMINSMIAGYNSLPKQEKSVSNENKNI